jgi:Kdo2-lipid IVA lauroyltransferase/acyltransferase
LDFKDKFNEFQAFLLDKVARKCARGKFSRKKAFIKFFVRLLRLMPFSRWDYTVDSIARHLKLSTAEAEKLTYETFESFITNAFEMSALKYLTTEELKNKLSVNGLNNLEAALSKKKGAIIISAHFGLWEFVPPWITASGYQTTTVVRRQNNKHIDAWFEEMRQKHGGKTTDSGFGIREILRALKNGEILALMVDQDNGKAGIFVKFFDEWASAPTGPAIISLKTGAPVVPLAAYPDYENKHRLEIFEPIYPQNYINDLAGQQKFTQDYTKIIENMIRQDPKLWFWVHRRWKTRPCDAPDNQWLIKSEMLDEKK